MNKNMDKKTGFNFIDERYIDILNINIKYYIHHKTGARHYHLACDDDNQVFMVALRTLPEDSTGVAHILEHVVLCGSEKYPVRDPFFLMLRRSLSNFMNALTSSDWTAYPFATQIQKDYDNLLEVYLDAVFFPKIEYTDFMQEGWRFDFSQANNEQSDLVYKGVVFNEMKGAMGSPTYQLWQKLCKHLFQQSTYQYNSGGEPLIIPQLSHQQLLDFHAHYYHPSNAVFLTYGNGDYLHTQNKINDFVLQRFTKKNDIRTLSKEPKRQSPIHAVEYYPVEKKKKRSTHIVMAWLLNDSHAIDNLLHANLLTMLLLDNPSSPLRYVLENTDLGEAPSPLCGLEDDIQQMVFIVGLEGCDEDSEQQINDLIINELQRLVEQGIANEQIEACIHQLELSQRELDGSSSFGSSHGLNLLLSITSAAIHGAPIFDLLDIDKSLKTLRQKCQDKSFIQQLLQQLLIDNQHRVSLVMKADENLPNQLLQEEKEQLNKKLSQFKEEEKKAIIANNQTLEKRQAEQPNVDILPSVSTSDVKIDSRFILPTQKQKNICSYATQTNGLVYTHGIFSIPQLSLQQLQLMPLISLLIPEVGYSDKSYTTVQNEIARYTGGISAHCQLWQPLSQDSSANKDELYAQLIFGSSALTDNADKMFSILQQVVEQATFTETDHIKDLIIQSALMAEKSVSSSGHILAMQTASSMLSNKALTHSLLSGLHHIKQMIELKQSLLENKKITDITEPLSELYEYLQRHWQHQWLLIADKSDLIHSQNNWQQQINLSSNPTAEQGQFKSPVSEPKNSAWSMTTQVNYCARAYPAVDILHPDSATFEVLANYLRNDYLHTAIREKGGAYGGGCNYNFFSQTFRFFSYRDPRLEETFADFSQAIQQANKKKISATSLEQAKLNAVSKMIAPSSPVAEVKRDYYADQQGIDKNFRDNRLRNVLNVGSEDIHRVLEHYLLNQQSIDVCITNNKKAEKLSQNKDNNFSHTMLNE